MYVYHVSSRYHKSDNFRKIYTNKSACTMLRLYSILDRRQIVRKPYIPWTYCADNSTVYYLSLFNDTRFNTRKLHQKGLFLSLFYNKEFYVKFTYEKRGWDSNKFIVKFDMERYDALHPSPKNQMQTDGFSQWLNNKQYP